MREKGDCVGNVEVLCGVRCCCYAEGCGKRGREIGRGLLAWQQSTTQREMFTHSSRLAEQSLQDGRMGILTDVTFKVFENFYLCTSSIFSTAVGRWVPILWTVLRNQREDDFADHFYHLFESLQEQDYDLKTIEDMMSGTVDFSQAQRAGFVSAYVRWRTRASGMSTLTSTAAQEAEQQEYANRAGTLLRG